MTRMSKHTQSQTVPVTERALVARINRKLAHQGKALRHSAPNSRQAHDLGAYFAIDVNRNVVTASWIDLEKWGNGLGCLKPWESLAE
jgi:hypothetical protein